MSSVIVVGTQWGDEGKGKVVDLWTERAKVVVRYGGGANAGHTLVIGKTKLVTHLIPSGVLHPHKRCVLGDGMVIDPHTLLEEIRECQDKGLLAHGELLVGLGAHVILPYHKLLEAVREGGKGAIGTTRRGIGPAYEAKAARRGVRIRDLYKPARLRELVERNLEEILPLLAHVGAEVPSREVQEQWITDALSAGEQLRQFVGDAGAYVSAAIARGEHVLFEGAQGTLLDLDHGTYPFVTSSSTLAAGACQSVGIGPTLVDSVVGISKAYATRVGSGPFPTELQNDLGEAIRQKGFEFGATTGRPRRCGWLDAAALRLAVRLSGLSGVALTKLDVLAGLPEVKMCVAYELDGERLLEPPQDLDDLARCTPIYETFAGWPELPKRASSMADLPKTVRDYAAALERVAGVPMAMISLGPDREETMILRDPFASTGA